MWMFRTKNIIDGLSLSLIILAQETRCRRFVERYQLVEVEGESVRDRAA